MLRENYFTKWLFPLFIALAPILVIIIQMSQFNFPKYDPFIGNIIYKPWERILHSTLILFIIMLILGLLFTTTIIYLKKIIRIVYGILICISLWIELIAAQRLVIFEYLYSINANGLAFLRPFMLESFPSKMSYIIFITIGLLWTGIIFLYVFIKEIILPPNPAQEPT